MTKQEFDIAVGEAAGKLISAIAGRVDGDRFEAADSAARATRDAQNATDSVTGYMPILRAAGLADDRLLVAVYGTAYAPNLR